MHAQCLDIAREALAAGALERAAKFGEKAMKLAPNDEVRGSLLVATGAAPCLCRRAGSCQFAQRTAHCRADLPVARDRARAWWPDKRGTAAGAQAPQGCPLAISGPVSRPVCFFQLDSQLSWALAVQWRCAAQGPPCALVSPAGARCRVLQGGMQPPPAAWPWQVAGVTLASSPGSCGHQAHAAHSLPVLCVLHDARERL